MLKYGKISYVEGKEDFIKMYDDRVSGEPDITLIGGTDGIGVSTLMRNYLHNEGEKLPVEVIDNTIQHYLTRYDSRIVSFRYTRDTNECFLYRATSVDGECEYISLVEAGDGITRFMGILTTVLVSGKNGTAILDNIDVYLHYTKFKLIWEMIFDLSERFNITVLASTQSIECIEAFNKYQLAYTGTRSSSYLEVYTNIKTGALVSTSRDKEQLQYTLSHGGKIRGE